MTETATWWADKRCPRCSGACKERIEEHEGGPNVIVCWCVQSEEDNNGCTWAETSVIYRY